MRASGWGSMHSATDGEAGGMLRKSRLGKEKGIIRARCQVCGIWKDTTQLDCLCVLCDECAEEHIHDA
jgi:hypothetical protein